MSERARPDANYKAGGVVGGYASTDAIGAAEPTIVVLRLNPITGRLLVDSNSGGTQVTDGEAIDAADTGTLILGTDGTNYQILSVNSSGQLAVNVQNSVAVTNAGLTELAAVINASNQMDVNIAASGVTVSVSGTFWQTTQPISIASMPSTPVTGIFWQTTQPVSIAGTVTVDGSGVTQPVSGTFWQATQPVSIASMPITPVTGTFWQATQPVSGTFWQTTQPVSATNLDIRDLK